MTDTQAWWIVVELGVVALVALLTLLGVRR